MQRRCPGRSGQGVGGGEARQREPGSHCVTAALRGPLGFLGFALPPEAGLLLRKHMSTPLKIQDHFRPYKRLSTGLGGDFYPFY